MCLTMHKTQYVCMSRPMAIFNEENDEILIKAIAVIADKPNIWGNSGNFCV